MRNALAEIAATVALAVLALPARTNVVRGLLVVLQKLLVLAPVDRTVLVEKSVAAADVLVIPRAKLKVALQREGSARLVRAAAVATTANVGVAANAQAVQEPLIRAKASLVLVYATTL